MLDLSLTTSVYFPAFVGFFMLIVKPGPTVPVSFGMAATTGSAATAATVIGEQRYDDSSPHDPPRGRVVAARG